MKCVGYDESLQRDIASRKPKDWYAEKRAEDAAKNAGQYRTPQHGQGKGKGRAKAQPKKVGTKKNSRKDAIIDEDEPDDYDEEDEEEEDDVVMDEIPRGTKSRPRRAV